jgi:rod shape determining protein RodA
MQPSRFHLDSSLFYALLLLAGLSLVILYSASGKNVDITLAHGARIALGFTALIIIAQFRPETIEKWSPWIFGIGLILLLITLAAGAISKGAQRWLSLGVVRFQPSELMKLGVPMMLAWFLSRGGIPPTMWRIAVALLIAGVPAGLVIEQPDLGSGLLVLASGLFVLFLAGLPVRYIVIAITGVAAALPVLWNYLHDYQRNRVLTLIDPTADPLGSGYHTLQSMIALGSGGWYGKGWLNSSQAHLEYLPESSTDFIFAVFGEEFGLIGILLIVALYGFITARCVLIAFYSHDSYSRLLAGGLALTFFIQFFVNIGMVSGILPVVGVPLPMMSYGGTSIVTMMMGFGVLMSIQTHRKIVEF